MKFYTTATNSRKKTVGVGGGARGQNVHTRTWTHGVRVESTVYDAKTPREVIGFSLYSTHGSDATGADVYIGEVVLKNGVPKFKLAKKWQKKINNEGRV